MEARFELISYEGPKRVQMAAFMLKGTAKVWFNLWKRSLPEGTVITWEEFKEKFLAEYQPECLRERRAYEFKSLTCVACGSVDAYAQRFMDLCDYAPALVATDRLKARRFVKGLPEHMRRVLTSHIHLTFAETMD